jgi:2,4-dienoyl-CoA reductase-like NADH-dependent reductase (Old Yellow Enzyme family)
VRAEPGSTAIDLDEPSRLYRELIAWGAPVTNVSLGHPRYQPHLNRPHDQSLAGVAKPPEHPLIGVRRFIDMTAHAQRLDPAVPLVSAGLSWLRQHMGNVGAAMIRDGQSTFLGLGRMAFAYPDYPKVLLAGSAPDLKKVCISCSMCSQIMKDAVAETGCVVRDKAIYAPKYALGRKAAKAKGMA